MRGIIMRHFVS